MDNFILKYLNTYFEEVKPLEFYRDIFPLGELEEKEERIRGKYNAIAVELLPKEENQDYRYRTQNHTPPQGGSYRRRSGHPTQD